MNGFDIQSALQVAKQLRGMQRRADTFGHDRERVLEEISFMAENFEKLAERIERTMEDEYYDRMSDMLSDGHACLGYAA